jgi:hypothetical protein
MNISFRNKPRDCPFAFSNNLTKRFVAHAAKGTVMISSSFKVARPLGGNHQTHSLDNYVAGCRFRERKRGALIMQTASRKCQCHGCHESHTFTTWFHTHISLQTIRRAARQYSNTSCEIPNLTQIKKTFRASARSGCRSSGL